MNKIIIIGHPASGLAEVEGLLRQSGMKSPLPSRREGLLPTEITDAISKAHQVPSAAACTRESDFSPVRPAAVWQLPALDLLLGNVSEDPWGWADPQMVFFLDYWRDLDPEAAFLLVYDAPRRVLAEAARYDTEEPGEQRIEGQLASWVAYNGAMLRFFLRNPDRCLLINTRQALLTPEDFLRQLSPRLSGKPLILGANPAGSQAKSSPPPASRRDLSTALAVTTHHSASSLVTLQAVPTEDYLLDHYADHHPASQQLFQEIQSAASVPLHVTTEVEHTIGQAWEALVAQRRLAMDVIVQLHQERHLFLMQLHEVQSQLEMLHMRGLTWERQQLQFRKERENQKRPKPPKGPTGAADRVKQQLSYRLGNTLVTGSRSVGGVLGMPFAIVGQVRCYQRDKKQIARQKLPPIHRYADAKEAERVKQQLSYRLGNVLVKHGGNPLGWLKLPFAMRKEIAAFHAERKARKNSSPS